MTMLAGCSNGHAVDDRAQDIACNLDGITCRSEPVGPHLPIERVEQELRMSAPTATARSPRPGI